MRVAVRSWRHIALAVVLSFVGLGFFGAGGLLLVVALTPAPDIASFADRQVMQSTKIYDRTGQTLLYDYNRDARRDIVTLSNISPNAINATIAVEDSSFYSHGGVRFTSIIRAALADITPGGSTQGGSTITQQVVKNTLLTSKKSIIRKIHEFVLAIRLEETYSKDAILETYLNSIPYGGVLYGIGAASETHFGVPAKDLTLAQAAYLAALIQAPSYYSPHGAHREELDTRKNIVLERMFELGFITQTEHDEARTKEVFFASAGAQGIVAPHFVFYILNYLEETYGATALLSGLKVTTTLDTNLQIKAEEVVNRRALKNAVGGGAENAALIALDPATGQILSMVGSRDFFDPNIDGQYNAALALRQPGSTMKPFIYSLALERGYTRDTAIFDVPTQFSTACSPAATTNNTYPCYAPRNYDGKFRGPMTFATALAQSVNIPAIKTLYLVGVRTAIERAQAMGLTSLDDPNRYGLTLVLGGGEVRLLDLVSAFGTFGNEGVRHPPTGILEVRDSAGIVLKQFSSSPIQAMPSWSARTISAMLSDPIARIPEYRPGGVMDIPGYEVAVKTGTTDDSKDAWTVGYTPSVALGVWVGNNDNTPAASLAGLVAAPMWKEMMTYAVSMYPKKYFGEPEPAPLNVHPILRGIWCIPDASGSAVPHSLLYWTDKSSPQGPPPSDPGSDPQFAAWEYGISAYYATNPNLFFCGVTQPATETGV